MVTGWGGSKVVGQRVGGAFGSEAGGGLPHSSTYDLMKISRGLRPSAALTLATKRRVATRQAAADATSRALVLIVSDRRERSSVKQSCMYTPPPSRGHRLLEIVLKKQC